MEEKYELNIMRQFALQIPFLIEYSSYITLDFVWVIVVWLDDILDYAVCLRIGKLLM